MPVGLIVSMQGFSLLESPDLIGLRTGIPPELYRRTEPMVQFAGQGGAESIKRSVRRYTPRGGEDRSEGDEDFRERDPPDPVGDPSAAGREDDDYQVTSTRSHRGNGRVPQVSVWRLF